MIRQERWVLFRDLPRRILLATKVREHLGVYLLASLSNAFLASSQYLAVSSAVASYLPVDSGTATLIAAYGPSLGIFLALLLNSLVFQGILAALVVILSLSTVLKTSWRWAYAFSGMMVSGFVGYWLGARFLVVLECISTLQNNRVECSNESASLFWFGIASTLFYLAVILL